MTVFSALYINRTLHCDEAVFLYISESVSEGNLLYRDVADIKLPGIFYLGAGIFRLFGESFIAARIVTYLFHLGSAYLIYRIGKQFKNTQVGMISSILFLLGMFVPQYNGFNFITECFAVFFMLLSIFFYFNKKRYFLSGIALGLGILFKQTSFLLFGAYFLHSALKLRYPEKRTKLFFKTSFIRLLMIFIGSVIPFTVTLLFFFLNGAAAEMLYYTVFFAGEYALPSFPIFILLAIAAFLPIYLFSVGSFLDYLLVYKSGKKTASGQQFSLLLFFLFLIPVLYIAPDHRTIFLIPGAVLSGSLFLSDLINDFNRSRLTKLKVFALLSLLLSTGIAIGTNVYYFDYKDASRPSLSEQMDQAESIEQSVNTSTIFIFPLCQSAYFFSDLSPGVRHLGSYVSMKVTQETIMDLEENNITFIAITTQFAEKMENNISLSYEPVTRTFLYEYIVDNYEKISESTYFVIYKKS